MSGGSWVIGDRRAQPSRLGAVFVPLHAQRSTRVVGVDGSRKLRLLTLTVALFFWCLGIIWRLYSLQISRYEVWQEWALKQHLAQVKVASERGPILDRNGRYLAVSVPATSLYVRPRMLKGGIARDSQIEKVSNELGISPNKLIEKFNSQQPFVWLKRQLPRDRAEQVLHLGIPAIGSILESKRHYPYAQAGSALFGKVGVDGEGLSGLEMQYEHLLRGEGFAGILRRDALGNLIERQPEATETLENKSFQLPKGAPIRLTVDAEIQSLLDEELRIGQEATGAKATFAVMVDADNGEVLGMGQSPSVDFNQQLSGNKEALKNIIIETVYEPGSTLKPLVAAAAIEMGLVKPEDMFDCEHGRFSYASRVIKDTHPYGILSLHDVIVRSSNIGIAKVGMKLGPELLYHSLRQFGFGSYSGISLPGESVGILRDYKRWAKIDLATHSFGQGVAVTPLQLVRGMSVIVNGGVLNPLKLVLKSDSIPEPGMRIISTKTAEAVRGMMNDVVAGEHGTGRKAKIEGVSIGGKTGTAQKVRAGGRGYAAGAYMSSFIGFADTQDLGLGRRLVLLVVVDEPKGQIYGGAVAAPIFERVVRRTINLLSSAAGSKAPRGRLPGTSDQLPKTLFPVSIKGEGGIDHLGRAQATT